jgi:hypothetical protein
MGYNLWLSEDSHCALGLRIGGHAATPAAGPRPERRRDAPRAPGRAHAARVDLLMATLVRRLEPRIR